jgi:hypothetical protein
VRTFSGFQTRSDFFSQDQVKMVKSACSAVLMFAAVYCACCFTPILFGIVYLMSGYRPSMKSYVGELVSAEVTTVSSGNWVIRQKFLLNNVTTGAMYCTVTRFKEYTSYQKVLAIQNTTAIGSHRRVWRSITDHSVCYDKAETQYYYIGGVTCASIAAGGILVIYAGLVFWKLLELPFPSRTPQAEPVATEDVELAVLDVGLK